MRAGDKIASLLLEHSTLLWVSKKAAKLLHPATRRAFLLESFWESKPNEYGQNLISESSHEGRSPFTEPTLPNRENNPLLSNSASDSVTDYGALKSLK